MSFLTAAGFAIPTVAALASAGNAAPMLKSAAIRSMGLCQEGALQLIATTVRESAITRHQMDFARVDRRSAALSQLKGSIADLKTRMERKSASRSRLATAETGLQLSCKAS